MRPVLRSRGFALVMLAAFLLAQPAALCTVLCLVERHHAAAHDMPHATRGATALTTSCHTTSAGTISADRFNILSPMAPTRAPAVPLASTRPVPQVHPCSALPRQIFATVESPPPRVA